MVATNDDSNSKFAGTVVSKILGTCNLGYCAFKKDGYVLLRYASGIMVEPVVTISGEEMESQGISKVLNYLRSNPLQESKRMSYFDEKTKKVLLQIKRDYTLVALSLLRSNSLPLSFCDVDELKVTPLHFGRGWSFDQRADEVLRIKLPITNEQFLVVLREAFDVAD